jgi:hypothetical protein
MEHVSEGARVLLRAAREVHAERSGAATFLPGSRLLFPEAAKRSGIRSDRQRYYDALEELEYEGPSNGIRARDTQGGTSTT